MDRCVRRIVGMPQRMPIELRLPCGCWCGSHSTSIGRRVGAVVITSLPDSYRYAQGRAEVASTRNRCVYTKNIPGGAWDAYGSPLGSRFGVRDVRSD
ncbi:MAG: hypothetical protein CMJ25_05590 [Phycisphaerae bacterium]|nr:hypothetical protein [Phycisphaerae bacterium]